MIGASGPGPQVPDLDIAAIVRVLGAHGVEFVVIGGAAAIVRDLPVPATVDIDITPSRSDANLERLAAAFDELDAALLTAEPDGTWFPRRPVENWAQYDTLHLMTRFGLLDVVFLPDGAPAGYDDLVMAAERCAVLSEDVTALVVTTRTWVRLKEASGRSKDLEHLDLYREGGAPT